MLLEVSEKIKTVLPVTAKSYHSVPVCVAVPFMLANTSYLEGVSAIPEMSMTKSSFVQATNNISSKSSNVFKV